MAHDVHRWGCLPHEWSCKQAQLSLLWTEMAVWVCVRPPRRYCLVWQMRSAENIIWNIYMDMFVTFASFHKSVSLNKKKMVKFCVNMTMLPATLSHEVWRTLYVKFSNRVIGRILPMLWPPTKFRPVTVGFFPVGCIKYLIYIKKI